MAGYRIIANKHIAPQIGAIKLKALNADHVDKWLDGLTSKLSTRSLQSVHSILRRAIRQAQARDKVLRNVAELVTTPEGQRKGRPSKTLTLDQATAVMEAAKASSLHAYVVLTIMTGQHPDRYRAGGRQRPPDVPRDHQSGQGRRRLGAPGDTAHVRLDHE